MGKVSLAVSDNYGETVTVAFHHHGLALCRMGAEDLSLDFEEVECTGTKEMDRHTEQEW